jgi:acyl CoA:acetate/3-ketoacid CoA transferase
MEILTEVANDLKINKEALARSSLKIFLNKELSDIEAEMFKIASKHGIETNS